MKLAIQTVILVFVLATLPASASAQNEATGTRPASDSGPTEVTVCLYLIDVSKIDGADQSFTAELLILLSWHDPRLEGVF